jgi:hypothetical protein
VSWHTIVAFQKWLIVTDHHPDNQEYHPKHVGRVCGGSPNDSRLSVVDPLDGRAGAWQQS